MPKIFFPLILIAGIVLLGWLMFAPESINVNAAGTTDVTATITSSVSCAAAPATTTFGTLTTSSIFTSANNIVATTSCNYAAGCNISVYDAGQGAGQPGLYSSGASDLIESSTATLSAGEEGYGIQTATTTTGSGAQLALNAIYYKTGNNVGGLYTSASAQQLASSTLPTANREVQITHKAAISGLTKAGSYADTITYSCAGN